MLTMLDSVDPAQIALAIRNGARPDALLGYSDGRFDDYKAIAAEAGGLPVYALDVYGDTANAEGEDTEPGNISVPGAAAALAAEKARGVDRPIGYCPESWAQALVTAAAAHGLSGSTTAAGRTDWRLVTAHYGQGQHICGPSTCGCPVEANATQWADVGPHGENVDQSILDADFLNAASHPGPPTAKPAPTAPPATTGAPVTLGASMQAVPFTCTTDAAGWVAFSVPLPAGATKNDVVSVVLDAGSAYDGAWAIAAGSVDYQPVTAGTCRVVVRGPAGKYFTGRVFVAPPTP